MVLNSRVASITNDRIVTALAPGGTGIEMRYTDASTTNLTGFAAMIVVPQPLGDGKAYLFIPTSGSENWAEAPWERVAGSSGSYPRNADDIAMILLYTTNSFTMSAISGTIGELYVGQLTNDTASLRLQTGSIRFSRTTGKPGTIMVTGGATDKKIFHLYTGGSGAGSTLNINTGADGVDFDMGYSLDLTNTVTKNNNITRVYTVYSNITIPEGSTLRFCNGTRNLCWDLGDSQEPNVYIQFNGEGKILGGGTLWMDTAASCTFWANCSSFYGLIRSSANSAARGADFTDRQATFFLRSSTVSNCALQVAGHVTSALEGRYSVGTAAGGNTHGYGSHGPYANRLPEQELTTSGGYLTFQYEANGWGEFTVQTQLTQRLVVDKGLTVMYMTATAWTLAPYNTFTALSMTNAHKGTFFIDEPHTRNNNTTDRADTTLGGFADHAIGGTGNLASETYPVVPWIVARRDSNADLIFAAVNASTEIMFRPTRNNTTLESVSDPLLNLYSSGNSVAISSDRTVNSLWLDNSGEGKTLGEGRTLTITSGGLILYDTGTAIGTQSGGTTNGSLVFGNTAYVYATSTNEATPQSIWSPVTAAKGLVCGYYGTLLLAGDQTGIDGEIVVNNGKLILGDLAGTTKADIDANLRIVGGNSKVQVTVADTLWKSEVTFDDMCEGATGSYSGARLILPDGVTELCRKIYFGTDSKAVPRSVSCGATGSGADIIDDIHFSGTGKLVARLDDILGTRLMIR